MFCSFTTVFFFCFFLDWGLLVCACVSVCVCGETDVQVLGMILVVSYLSPKSGLHMILFYKTIP